MSNSSIPDLQQIYDLFLPYRLELDELIAIYLIWTRCEWERRQAVER